MASLAREHLRLVDDSARDADPSGDQMPADEFDPSLDQPEYDARLDQKAEAYEKRQREALAHAKKSRAVFLRLALLHSALPHAPFRVLAFLADKADADLSNCFVGRRAAAKALGMKLDAYRANLAALRRAGWIRAHAYQRSDGGQTTSCIQFLVPVEVIKPSGEPWAGPTRWEKRVAGAPMPPRKNGRPPLVAQLPTPPGNSPTNAP